MKHSANQILLWTPRILSIIFILFLMLFSLDVFSEKSGFWETVLGLLTHNIPAFVLLIVLIISWKHEMVGAVAFNLAGLLYIGWLLTASHPQITNSQHPELVMLAWFMAISAPALIIGGLFLVNWMGKKGALVR